MNHLVKRFLLDLIDQMINFEEEGGMELGKVVGMEQAKVVVWMEQAKMGMEKVEMGLGITHFGEVKVGMEKVEMGLEITHFGEVKVGMEKLEMGLEMTGFGNLKKKQIR